MQPSLEVVIQNLRYLAVGSPAEQWCNDAITLLLQQEEEIDWLYREISQRGEYAAGEDT